MNTHAVTLAFVLGSFACSDTEKSTAYPPKDAEMVAIQPSRISLNQVSCRLDEEVFNALITRGESLDGNSENPAALLGSVAAVDVPAFKIDKRTVGCDLWSACVAAGRCVDDYAKRCYGDLVQKSYKQATALCTWRGGRLPTYAEWQRAMRGPNSKVWGIDDPRASAQSCSPGKRIKRFHETCELISEDGVISYTEDGSEWTLELSCRDEKRHPALMLRTIATTTGRLDAYSIIHSETPDDERWRFQFRCAFPVE